MAINFLSKSFWGLNWQKNLLTRDTLKNFSKEKIIPGKKSLTDQDFEQYLRLLDDQIQDERERLSGIENKAIQLVGQISIVLTIIGLFVPFILDKIPSEKLVLKIILVIGLVLITIIFVYSIVCALRNFNLPKYIFAKGTEYTILEHHNGKIENLKYEIINDKILELKSSRHSTNAKASNVIYAFRAFKTAIVMLVAYVLIYSVALFFIPDSPQKVELTQDTIKQIQRTTQPLKK